MKLILATAALVLGVIAISVLWYRLWFDSSFPGPPQILRLFLKADGEGAYDLVLYDSIAFTGMCTIGILLVRAYARRISKSNQ